MALFCSQLEAHFQYISEVDDPVNRVVHFMGYPGRQLTDSRKLACTDSFGPGLFFFFDLFQKLLVRLQQFPGALLHSHFKLITVFQEFIVHVLDPEHCPYFVQQFVGVNGLGQVVVAPKLHGLDLGGDVLVRR